MKRECGDVRIIVVRLLLTSLTIIVAALVIPRLFMPRSEPNEASAVAGLSTVNSAQTIYAKDHPDKGFASSLAELGPPPGAGLIDALFASREKKGYIFIIVPAANPKRPIVKYIATARLKKFGKSGSYAFFTDETGAMHYTKDNRAATLQDPELK